MKSDLLKMRFFLPRKEGGLRRGRRFHLLLVFLITILLPLILELGCNGGGGGGSSTASISRKLFVTNSGVDKISVFDVNEIFNTSPDENGNVDVHPIRAIGSNTGLSEPKGIFVDRVNDEIFVTNSGNNTVTVYGRTDNGDVSPKRTIGGEKTELSAPQGIFVDTKNNEIFVANFSTITVYERTAAGNCSPLRTIGGEKTGLFASFGIYVDTKNNEIFVTSFNFETLVGNILVYRRTDEGNIPPLRSIVISELTDEGFPFFPTSVYVDVDNDELFVVDFGIRIPGSGLPIIPLVGVNPFPIQETFDSTIKVYRRTDEGNAKPLRTIRGKNTGLLNPSGISVDTQNNEIFVVNEFNNTVTVYRRTDTGDVQPLRTLSILDSNSAGILGDRSNSFGIYVDPKNDEIFVANQNDTITVYGGTAKEDDPPLRIIGPKTGLLDPRWIYVDTKNNEIFVSNRLSRLITVYGITDDGNIAPLRTIPQGELKPEGLFVDMENNEIFVANGRPSDALPDAVTVYRMTDGIPLRSLVGLNTGLQAPVGLYVDTKNNEIFVANSGNDTITVYGRTVEGDVTPLKTIEGENTGLSGPAGIFIDTKNNEIFVANSGNDTITVYKRTPEGGFSLSKTIGGENTELHTPAGIFVDTESNEIFVSNFGNNTITVYRRTPEGDISLSRTIEGSNTGLLGPIGIFVAESP